ncbi:MAG TPA: type II secretion system F family protein [Vicinamibacterales bacterium]
MVAAFLVFIMVTAMILGGYAAVSYVPGAIERRRLEQRLREVGPVADEAETSVVSRPAEGPLPGVDKMLGQIDAGKRLATWLEQAGTGTTPGAFVVTTLGFGATAAVLAYLFTGQVFAPLAAAPMGAAMPAFWLARRRSSRLRKFEEEFPEALDLLSRAIRAGHAFQTGLGMVAGEMRAPVGPEFKKVFDQQNFGLPLRDAMNGLALRVPLLDVRFFITAVAIQRDTGGNLSEILDNLSHVVRERFKIQRQVRVHSAHGRITGFVLLALPAALGVALSFINADHMKLLWVEQMGRTMLMAAIVMQTVGFVWIKKVIKIEV